MVDIPASGATTASITVGGTVDGTLEVAGDHDWFRIQLVAGQEISVALEGLTLIDPYLRIRDASGVILYENDDLDAGVNRDSLVSFMATYTGTYYIDVGAWNEGAPAVPGDPPDTGTYRLTVTPYVLPTVATLDEIADQLISSGAHFDVTQGESISVNITALTAAGQNLARHALAMWSDIIGVSFVEVATGGQITFDDNEPGGFADRNTSGGFITSAHVNVSTGWLQQFGTGLNTRSFHTYIHEIGHALGLTHAGNYNGSARYPYDASFLNDSWVSA